jgi:predicted nucleic acid-binding protein
VKKIGHPIPENDIWVAATCLEVGVPLLTRDGHFDYIRGLEVINWEEQEQNPFGEI